MDEFQQPANKDQFREHHMSRGWSSLKRRGTEMNHHLNTVLGSIDEEFKSRIQKGSRHYIEINVGERAGKLGFGDLEEKYRHALAIVPLKSPQSGMKVRIDGRTFVNYAEYASGIAVPGYLAREAGQAFKTFVPNDSMICNFN
jgi:hypothetical protein